MTYQMLLVHGGGVQFWGRKWADGRIHLFFVTSTRSGALGEPDGYDTWEQAHTAACGYASP